MNENDAQIPNEGEPAFPVSDKENDNSSDSQSVDDANKGDDTKQTTDDQTQSDEGEQNSDETKDGDGEKKGDRGHADDPAWIKREESWKNRFNDQEERHTAELTTLREDFEQRFTDLKPKGEDGESVQVPSWWAGDEAEFVQFVKWNDERREASQKQLRDTLASEGEAEQKADKKKVTEATDYLNDEMAAIEADSVLNPTGAKIDRNALLKFTMDEDLVDSKGRWNYRAAFRLMTKEKVTKAEDALDEKKNAAAATTSEGGAETKAPPFMTTQDFKKPDARPW